MSSCFVGYPQVYEIILLFKTVPDMVANSASRVGNRLFHSFSALPSLRREASAAVGHSLETEDRGARLDLVEDHRVRPRGRGRAEGRVARILAARLGERAEHSRSGGDILDVVATCNLGCRSGANAQGRGLGAGDKEGGKKQGCSIHRRASWSFFGVCISIRTKRVRRKGPSFGRRASANTGDVPVPAAADGSRKWARLRPRGRPRRTKGHGARAVSPPPPASLVEKVSLRH